MASSESTSPSTTEQILGLNCTVPEHHESHDEPPYTILFLFGIFIIGAFIRFLLKKIRLPYTVVLFVLGILFGLAANQYLPLGMYTDFVHISPHLILYIFLPILIFESAFALDAHTFTRCFVQCLLLAAPGLVIVTVLTAVLSVNLFTSYEWNWPTALLFGSILSATDPVAVVALLREIGASKTLSTLIEGESLLNDGSAIVAYAVLIQLVVPGQDVDTTTIVVKFCQISLGGPVLGYIMGKLSVFCLSRVFNDAIIEVTITLSAAYITYYLAEAVLKVSGVLSLLALGVVISSEKESISPEVEHFVHKFWENLSYLANTIIFVVVGIQISSVASEFVEKQDWFLICATYIGSTVFRLVMIGILSPALSRLGYGLSWQDSVVMTWGGLRGAVGLCLALLVPQVEGIDKHRVGHKILIHVAGIVLLTLLLNATTIKSLLKMLGMSNIPIWKRRIMAKAVHYLEDNLNKSIHVQKNNQFLADADWKMVEQITKIQDPYNTQQDDEDDESCVELVRFLTCNDCEMQHVIPPNRIELEEMFDQARLRMLNAQKETFWRQFENGLLAQENVRVLVGAAQVAADAEKGFIDVEDLKIHWKVPSYYTWMKRKLEGSIDRFSETLSTSSTATREPSVSERLKSPGLRAHLRKFLRTKTFEFIVYIIIVLNVVPVIVELVLLLGNVQAESKAIEALHVANYVFVCLYLSELTLKLIGFGPVLYWKSHWNKFDLLILTLTLTDTILTLVADMSYPHGHNEKPASTMLQISSILRLSRILRILRMLKLLCPRLLSLVNSRINVFLYAGYDIGCGLMVSLEEVMKRIEDIVDFEPIVKELQHICEQSRVQIVRELALLQEQHPSVVVAVKTRHAARHVLNSSRNELNELKEAGLLDDAVFDDLMARVEKRMKKLVNAPTSLLPSPPLELLKNIDWISDNEDLFNYLKSRAQVVKYEKGKRLGNLGDPPFGIYIITVGTIKIEGHVGGMNDGVLPNTDSFHWFSSQGDFEDFLTAGNVLGEMGVLTKRNRATSAICETEVQAFFISQESVERAFTMNSEWKLEYKMWRTCGLRIAKTVLTNNPQYGEWSMSRIMMHLQRAYLPNLRNVTDFVLESEMQDVILIQGKAKDVNTEENYTAVSYIPRTVYSLRFDEPNMVRPLMVVIGSVDMGPYPQNWIERRQRWSLCPQSAQARCLLHQVRRRSMMPGRTSRAHSKVSTISRGSWVDSMADYFREREGGFSQNVDIQDEPYDVTSRRRSQLILSASDMERRNKRRVSLQPDITTHVLLNDLSITIPPGRRSRGQTLNPSLEEDDTQSSQM